MPAFRNVDSRRASVHSMEHYASNGMPATLNSSLSFDETHIRIHLEPTRSAASPVHDHHVQPEEPLPSLPLHSLTPSSSCSPPPVARRPSTFRAGRRRGDPHRVTRPRNAFIIFRSSYIKSYRSNNCKEEEDDNDSHDRDQQDTADRHPPNQNEISKIAAKVWNIMSDEEKKPFCREAYAEREEHRRLHPNFVYAANGSSVARSRAKGKGKGKSAKSPTPIGSPEVAFIPLSEIPPLELPPPVTSDSNETYPMFAPDVPIFFPHIDRLPDLNYDLSRYPHGALPGRTLGDSQHNSSYTFPAELPPAYSAFMDDPQRHADYPLSSSASSDLPNDSLGSPVVDHSLTDDPTDSFFDFSAFAASADFRRP